MGRGLGGFKTKRMMRGDKEQEKDTRSEESEKEKRVGNNQESY